MPGEHGLQNDVGAYNCFLNVVIQGLWHLQSFRGAFQSQSGHVHAADAASCVFCALHALFVDLEFAAPGESVDPTLLRRTMATLHRDQGRFQMREIDDAAEAFDSLVERLHERLDTSRAKEMTTMASLAASLSGNGSSASTATTATTASSATTSSSASSSATDSSAGGKDALGAAHPDCRCFAHRIFAVQTALEAVCDSCRAASAPDTVHDRRLSEQFLLYTYAAQLRSQAAAFARAAADAPAIVGAPAPRRMVPTMDMLMHLASAADGGERRGCSVMQGKEPCGRMTRVRQILTSMPEVLPVGIVWDTPNATADEIHLLMAAISLRMDARNIFDAVDVKSSAADSTDARDATDGDPESIRHSKPRTTYALRGLICYYGQHYMGFFWSSDERRWLSFDDTVVRRPGVRGVATDEGLAASGIGLENHRDFAGVRSQCVRGRLQPNVLLYERETSGADAYSPDGDADDSDAQEPITATAAAGSGEGRAVTAFHGIVVSQLDQEAAAKAAAKSHIESVAAAEAAHITGSAAGGAAAAAAGTDVDSRAAAGESTGSDPEEGFVLVPGEEARPDAIVDVPVMRSNWFYRRDQRIFRLRPDSFARLPADTPPPAEAQDDTPAATSAVDANDDANVSEEQQDGSVDGASAEVTPAAAAEADADHRFLYQDVLKIVVPPGMSTNCVIHFKPDTYHASDAQHLSTTTPEDMSRLIRELLARCARHKNALDGVVPA